MNIIGDRMKFKYLFAILLSSIFLLSACQGDIKNAVDWPIRDDIVYTDQHNKSFALKDLKGKVWVSDFIFTSCTDICPPMTANMVRLQEMVKEKGLKNVEFVSFSVDPTVDSPKALAEFAKKFNVDQSNWSFLTGYSQDYIEVFAKNSFKTFVKKPSQGDQVVHGTSFYLVGPDGRIKKYYTGINKVPYDEIIKDIQALQ
jgi:protein SCO1/2